MKSRKPLVIVLVVLCLCVCIGGAFSLNITSLEGGNSAEVAAFAIDADVVPAETPETILAVQAGEQKIGTIFVSNEKNQVVGEVTTKYRIELTLDTELPENVSLCLKSVSSDKVYESSQVSSDGKIVTFESEDFLFEHGVKAENAYDVFIKWEKNSIRTKYDLTVTAAIVGEQID